MDNEVTAVTVLTEAEFSAALQGQQSPIVLGDNITLTGTYNIDYDLDLSAGGNYTLTWDGGIGTLSWLVVPATGSLTLSDITLDGNMKNRIKLVDVTGGTLVMNEGTTIRNSLEYGVNVENNGRFLMNGGLVTDIAMGDAAVNITESTVTMAGDAEISGNPCAGMNLYLATLNMTENARIVDNTGTQSGGGILSISSVINMGTAAGDAPQISRNTTPNNGGAIFLTSQSTLDMGYDAVIADNEAAAIAGGVVARGSTILLRGNASIADNVGKDFGGGVTLVEESALTLMDNASITGNSAVYGGGMVADNATITMGDMANVQGNTATEEGGGVHLRAGAAFTMTGAASIQENESVNGGGVYMTTASTMEMDGTPLGRAIRVDALVPRVINNTATGDGGGVYIADGDTALTMTGEATIAQNQAAGDGDGVYDAGTLNLAGDVQISDGLYIVAQENIPTITGALTGEAIIQLEESDYVDINSIPLLVGTGDTATYPVLTAGDAEAFVVPDSFTGYGTQLTAGADGVEIAVSDYSITYHDLYGVENPNPLEYNVADLPITLMAPSERAGYTFLGWYDAAGNPMTTIPVGTTGDLDIYARWEQTGGGTDWCRLFLTAFAICGLRNNQPRPPAPPVPPVPPVPQPIRISFDGNDRMPPYVRRVCDEMWCYPGDTVRIPYQAPVRRGYGFTGWNTRMDGTGARYCPGQWVEARHGMTLYAQWRRRGYC
ncbi:InlB B-repeat-containing protein [Eubacteriales bacterium OttesenSCG-928-M02]|nr:InlB B-repeat-containing protein [Eubacteriales bacterium OttesenSCG-928-M02]